MNESDGSKQADLTKHFTDEEMLPDVALGVRIDKEVFLKPRTVRIMDLYINRFGKNSISVIGDAKSTGEITLSNKLYMELKSKYGSVKANWKGKYLTLRAEKIEFKDRDNQDKSGYTLVLVE